MYLGGVGGLYLFSVYSGGGGPYVYALCALCMREEALCTNTPPTKGNYRYIRRPLGEACVKNKSFDERSE